jgi:hypothetical protein
VHGDSGAIHPFVGSINRHKNGGFFEMFVAKRMLTRFFPPQKWRFAWPEQPDPGKLAQQMYFGEDILIDDRTRLCGIRALRRKEAENRRNRVSKKVNRGAPRKALN